MIAAVRLLAVLCRCDPVLSLGPYVPGFRLLIDLPGFSFFRAPRGGAWPSRWPCRSWRGRVRRLARMAPAGADRWVVHVSRPSGFLVVLGLIELALASGSSSGKAVAGRRFSAASRRCPGPTIRDFLGVLAEYPGSRRATLGRR